MEYFYNFDKLSYVKGNKPDGCILCLIKDNSQEITDLTVYRNNLFIVTVNLYPYNPGHIMIFPVRHLEDIRDLVIEEEKDLLLLQRSFLQVMDSVFKPSGYNIGFNMGLPAGASISHLHLHIIPRYPNENGIADLIAGKRLLVESPIDSAKKIIKYLNDYPSSILTS